jgi:low affinity Fe/Cu permease
MRDLFDRLAHATARWAGRPVSFILAAGVILAWVVTGPIFGFSDTWQLVINTGTTIVTFLMVFLIQNTQNRDTLAIQLKLDELIRATEGAKNQLIDLEDETEDKLEEVKREFLVLRDAALRHAQAPQRPGGAAPAGPGAGPAASA